VSGPRAVQRAPFDAAAPIRTLLPRRPIASGQRILARSVAEPAVLTDIFMRGQHVVLHTASSRCADIGPDPSGAKTAVRILDEGTAIRFHTVPYRAGLWKNRTVTPINGNRRPVLNYVLQKLLPEIP